MNSSILMRKVFSKQIMIHQVPRLGCRTYSLSRSTAALISVHDQNRSRGKSRQNWGRTTFLTWGAIGTLALGLSSSASVLAQEERKSEILEGAGARKEGLPEYKSEEVAKHDSAEKRIWVTFKNGVYDITDFIPNHPGADKIMMAAGSSVEPFWSLYAVHKNNSEVYELLEACRIGNLHPDDVDQDAGELDSNDPWANEPRRHPALRVANRTPFNGETPLSLICGNFITPNELFYVRNHLPVPKVDEKNYEVEIEGLGVDSFNLTLNDLKTKFPKVSIVAVVQCGGNRRADMNASKSVMGLSWEGGSIGNAEWSGARLTDVLKHAGVDIEDPKIRHVQFEGADVGGDGLPYGASVPAEKGLDPRGDVILAYEMNGQPLPLDHGFPVRVIVPGVVGARHVKWLQKIILSDAESESHWQQNDYKILSPSVTTNPDFSKYPAIQSTPVTSVICEPGKASKVKVSPDGTVEVKGYAFSGGGSKIWRVDVSADGGQTWVEADLTSKSEIPNPPRHWAWTIWTAKVKVDNKTEEIEIVSKAVDSNNNVQPESYMGTWNLRGLLANAYSRVTVKLER